jgi:hypothetical protein
MIYLVAAAIAADRRDAMRREAKLSRLARLACCRRR